jgi:hypothetical protein
LAGVVLTSVLDHAHPVAPIDPAAVALTAGAQFDATFFGTDSFGNPVDVAAGLVTLNVGGSGKFTPVAPSSASSASLAVEGVISGSYDSAGTALPISLTLAGATLPTNSLPADFAGTNIGSGFFVPGGAGTIQTSNFALNPDGTPNCVFGTTNPACVGVSLPNGAKGQVTLALEDCATAGALSVGACNFGTAASPGNVVAHLTAELKQADGITPLYTYGAPASLTYVCSLTNCPWDPTHDDGSTIYNKWEESVESYADYPLHAQDGSTPNAQFYLVPPCQSLTAGEPAHPATTVPALGEKSCVDVKTLLRDVNPNSPSYGSLTFNILYYDDYKMVP